MVAHSSNKCECEEAEDLKQHDADVYAFVSHAYNYCKGDDAKDIINDSRTQYCVACTGGKLAHFFQCLNSDTYGSSCENDADEDILEHNVGIGAVVKEVSNCRTACQRNQNAYEGDKERSLARAL